jgi:fructosamine-3-kinase
MIPSEVQDWLAANEFGKIISEHPVSGGCINRGVILKTASGSSFFMKHNPAAPPDMFLREVEGLNALRVPEGPTVPRPYCHGSHYLLMEDLIPAPRTSAYWQLFGRRLAALHHHTNPQFGFPHDNYIGSTPQGNSWTEDGLEFFAEQRLMAIASAAKETRTLDLSVVIRVEGLASRLAELIPTQPASLIHGDLWSGNAMTNSQGGPAVIDPAAYYGWGEADLAMTALFGTFPDEFYEAYTEVRPLTPGYRDRFPIYNLYHLLNHVLLFGQGYLAQVNTILQQYS